MISAWTLMSLAPLLVSNIYALKKMKELQDALNMREILLGEDRGSGWARIAPGGTMALTLETPTRRIWITSKREARVRVRTV